MTVFTKGKGVTNMERRMSSLVSGLNSTSSNGFVNKLSQNFVPLLIAVSLVSRPPWLCPITTICRNAGSLPLGSNVRLPGSLSSALTAGIIRELG